tara:strand:+ start:220 stop:522 length:303 start_codon:yes stop_codon:yes gene_type:complete
MKHTIKVQPFYSNRTGNAVLNQYKIYTSKGVYFQSYNSIIALETPKGLILDKFYWDYSNTTSKYLREFIRMGKDETKEKIASKEIKLRNLNEEYIKLYKQ